MHSSEEYDMNNDWREYYDPQYVLMHHGIKGQKWGVRQYQNTDGTLTEAGKKRYGSGADRVEKFARKAASWEGRAINAKTGIGRQFSTSMAAFRRQKADKLGAKATGDYKMLAINKNAARNARAIAETNANVAAGLKKRADASSGIKQKVLMENAIKNLAAANNNEGMGAKLQAVSNAPFMMKAGTFITKTMKETTYSPSGRAKNIKDRVAETLGDQIISNVVKSKSETINQKIDNNISNKNANKAAKIGVKVATNVASKGVVSNARDIYYKSKNSQSKRWDKMAKG